MMGSCIFSLVISVAWSNMEIGFNEVPHLLVLLLHFLLVYYSYCGSGFKLIFHFLCFSSLARSSSDVHKRLLDNKCCTYLLCHLPIFSHYFVKGQPDEGEHADKNTTLGNKQIKEPKKLSQKRGVEEGRRQWSQGQTEGGEEALLECRGV